MNAEFPRKKLFAWTAIVQPPLLRWAQKIMNETRKDDETVHKFIELRSRGQSFSRIADELGVAKSTLINWSREHQYLIQNLRAMEWEQFLEQNVTFRQDRLHALSDELHRVEVEFARRDLSSVPTAQLPYVAEQLRRRLERESTPPRFRADFVPDGRADEVRVTQEWSA